MVNLLITSGMGPVNRLQDIHLFKAHSKHSASHMPPDAFYLTAGSSGPRTRILDWSVGLSRRVWVLSSSWSSRFWGGRKWGWSSFSCDFLMTHTIFEDWLVVQSPRVWVLLTRCCPRIYIGNHNLNSCVEFLADWRSLQYNKMRNWSIMSGMGPVNCLLSHRLGCDRAREHDER